MLQAQVIRHKDEPPISCVQEMGGSSSPGAAFFFALSVRCAEINMHFVTEFARLAIFSPKGMLFVDGGEGVGRNAAQAPPAPSLDAFPPQRFESYFHPGCAPPRREEPPSLGARTILAEEVGFEPTEPCGSTVFKTAAFNHSATPPCSPRTQGAQLSVG